MKSVLLQIISIRYRVPLLLSQDIAPLAAPDYQGDHRQREEHGDEDQNGQRVVRRIHPHHFLNSAVGEKVLVYADDVALDQRIGPVAGHSLGLLLCAEREEVVFTEEEHERRRRERLEENLH